MRKGINISFGQNMKNKMKKSFITLFLLFISTAYTLAQTYVTDAEIDSVTLQSKACYRTLLTSHNGTLFNDSKIIWTFPLGYGAADFTLTNGSSFPPADGFGAFSDSEIVMTPKAIASGLKLQAQERSYPKIGSGCVGNIVVMTIDVLNMPSISKYGSDSGGCGIPDLFRVPIYLTGYGKYDITLTVDAYDLKKNKIGSQQIISSINFVNARTTETSSLRELVIPSATLIAAAGALATSGCYFEIQAIDLQDRISKKTMGYIFGDPTKEIANPDPDGFQLYRYSSWPIPTIKPIKHITNVYN